MEISKAVQEEIIVVQNKLKNAIRDHQICIGKLKNDPNNARILTRVRDIQFYIIALGKCQKQMVQRLRKEVEAFKAQNTNGPLISLASLIGLDNNNDHIVDNNNEKKSKKDDESEVIKFSKEDYEEVVKNGDVSPPTTQENAPSKNRSSSVETISGEDEIIEVSMDENSNEMQEDAEKETKDEGVEQVTFLSNLGLVTAAKFAELQNRRVERKRRSTANPQFVYTCYDVPTKRKRCAYLQSGGNAIQTRQATARMNGESSPPLVKTTLSKSTSPPTKTVPKSQIVPVQKAMTRPNILRNTSESKVFAGKVKIENGGSSVQAPLSVSKVIQSSNSRTVHIPGLPSSLTIERIENDSIVCISCRNPGILIICEHCSAKYHISCHTISPAPPRTCPKCAMVNNEVVNEEEEEEEEEEDVNKGSFNKSAELVTTTNAPRIIRKAGEDAEIHKTHGGLHKVDATTNRHMLTSTLGIGQLPSSTFLIPIASSSATAAAAAVTATATATTTAAGHTAATINPTARDDDDQSESQNGNISCAPIIVNNLSGSNVTYFQSDCPYTYSLPLSSTQPEKHQSYLIVKKISDPFGRPATKPAIAAPPTTTAATATTTATEEQGFATIYDTQLPSTSGYACVNGDQPESNVFANLSVFHDNCGSATAATVVPSGPATVVCTGAATVTTGATTVSGGAPPTVSRNRRKSVHNIRALPPLTRIIDSEEIAGCQTDGGDFYNGKKSRIKHSRIKLGIKLRPTAKPAEYLLPSYSIAAESNDQQQQQQQCNNKQQQQFSIASDNADEPSNSLVPNNIRTMQKSRANGIFHTLFAGGYQSCVLTNSSVVSRTVHATSSAVSKQDDVQYYHEYAYKQQQQQKQQQQHSQQQQQQNFYLDSSVELCPNERGIAKFFEHVKLEEAHLSAPPRAKLARESARLVEEKGVDVKEKDSLEVPPKVRQDRQRLNALSDKRKGSTVDSCEIKVQVEVMRRRKKPKPKPRKRRKKRKTKLQARKIEAEPKKSSSTDAHDETTDENCRSLGNNKEERGNTTSHEDNKVAVADEKEVHSKDPLRGDVAQQPRHNEQPVPQDKADVERQDCRIAILRRERSLSTSSSASSDDYSDTPEQASTADMVGEQRRSSGEHDLHQDLAIDNVSPESIHVLEQYESAMLKIDHGNAAAC